MPELRARAEIDADLATVDRWDSGAWPAFVQQPARNRLMRDVAPLLVALDGRSYCQLCGEHHRQCAEGLFDELKAERDAAVQRADQLVTIQRREQKHFEALNAKVATTEARAVQAEHQMGVFVDELHDRLMQLRAAERALAHQVVLTHEVTADRDRLVVMWKESQG